MKRWIVLALLLLTAGLGAQARIDEPSLKALLAKDKTVVVLDVRTAEEYASGRLALAKLLPFDAIDANSASKLIPTKNTTVVVYCRSGRRSALAAETLKNLGYTKVWDFGGLPNWHGPLVTGPAK